MNLIILGPPGAGKGTQADLLSSTYDLFKIATGDLIREEIQKETELGQSIKAIVDVGELPDDTIVNQMVENFIRDNCPTGEFILDGYPRTLEQAKVLDDLLRRLSLSIDLVINLKVEEEYIIKRILGRFVCVACGENYHDEFHPPKDPGKCDRCEGTDFSRRSDDSEETLRKRFQIYRERTQPIVAFYEQKALLKSVDGSRTIQEVSDQIKKVLSDNGLIESLDISYSG